MALYVKKQQQQQFNVDFVLLKQGPAAWERTREFIFIVLRREFEAASLSWSDVARNAERKSKEITVSGGPGAVVSGRKQQQAVGRQSRVNT